MTALGSKEKTATIFTVNNVTIIYKIISLSLLVANLFYTDGAVQPDQIIALTFGALHRVSWIVPLGSCLCNVLLD